MSVTLNKIEIQSKFYSIIFKFRYLILILLYFYPLYTIITIIIILSIVIIEVYSSSHKKNTVSFKDDKDNLIGFINGERNYIHKWMVLPEYQQNGIGKKLLNRYLKQFCNKCKTYSFKTSILLDTLYIYEKYKKSNIYTDNYFFYKINVPID